MKRNPLSLPATVEEVVLDALSTVEEVVIDASASTEEVVRDGLSSIEEAGLDVSATWLGPGVTSPAPQPASTSVARTTAPKISPIGREPF